MGTVRCAAAALLAGLAVCATQAAEIFSPGLPASPEQSLACRIVNVSAQNQVVTSQAVDSAAGIVTFVRNEVLRPGESGGFAVPGREYTMYCKFVVTGTTQDFRASIEVFELTPTGNFRIVTALPAR